MNYSENLNKILTLCKEEAQRLGCPSVTPDLLLLAIFKAEESRACQLLLEAGVNLTKAKQILEIRNTHIETLEGLPEYDKTTQRIIRIVDLEAKSYQAPEAHSEHLLLAILRERVNRAANYLAESWQVTYESMEKALPHEEKASAQQPDPTPDFAEFIAAGGPKLEEPGTSSRGNSSSKTPALDKFGKDLSKQAAEGTIDPVVGRTDEIERVIEILSRRKKNNPVLIGEPGVGKSAIVEGLALRIFQHEVSPLLFEKRIIALDLASLVAGTTYRGQFEERIKSIINELQNNPEIILFIDEFHTIIGAGGAEGSLDAANILKPALARGEIQCIGATTLKEYSKSIEKDGALERRFQKVTVQPATAEETLAILQRIAPIYGKHHNVHYSDEVLRACVLLTERYISNRSFPDKAIDALDEVGAQAQMLMLKKPDFIEEIDRECAALEAAQSNSVNESDFKQAIALSEKKEALQTRLHDSIAQWKEERQSEATLLTVDDVARVVSRMSGVPVQRVQADESVRLRSLGSVLKQRVIGQDEAVSVIVKAIQRSRLGLSEPNHPIGTFFFLGSTGVGKTHLAQCLAEEMFGSKDALIRFDMSEYMEEHSVSLLVGAPPGYVAHEEGGKLTEAVRRRPYSIVLFDEIEKAHANIFNILLQVLDEGRLTDRQGRVVDFRNTIIILTSNVGTRQLREYGTGVGFQSAEGVSSQQERSILLKALQKQFPPEFVNRLDNIVTFQKLTAESLHSIIELELRGLRSRVESMGYSLTITPEVKDHLIAQSDSSQYGARPLKRAIQSSVEDALTTLLLDSSTTSTSILISLVDGQVVASWAAAEDDATVSEGAAEDKETAASEGAVGEAAAS